MFNVKRKEKENEKDESYGFRTERSAGTEQLW
jgi:hypothetical protein